MRGAYFVIHSVSAQYYGYEEASTNIVMVLKSRMMRRMGLAAHMVK
jgi:hypothetical protein